MRHGDMRSQRIFLQDELDYMVTKLLTVGFKIFIDLKLIFIFGCSGSHMSNCLQFGFKTRQLPYPFLLWQISTASSKYSLIHTKRAYYLQVSLTVGIKDCFLLSTCGVCPICNLDLFFECWTICEFHTTLRFCFSSAILCRELALLASNFNIILLPKVFVFNGTQTRDPKETTKGRSPI